MVFLAVLVAWIRRRLRTGPFHRGGVISGATALGFMVATSIAILTRDWSVTLLALALALLILQGHLQTRNHTVLEVILGAALGSLLAWLLFLWPQ